MVYSRFSFPKILICVVLMGFAGNSLQAGVLSGTGAILKGTPWLAGSVTKGLYSGLKFIGRGSALDGAVICGALIGASCLVTALKHYYYGLGLSKRPESVQSPTKFVPAISLRGLRNQLDEYAENFTEVKSALNRKDVNQLKANLRILLKLGGDASDREIQSEIDKAIGELEKIRNNLAPFLTLGGSLGAPGEIDNPLICFYPNRFLVVLDAYRSEYIKNGNNSNGVATALSMQRKIDDLPLNLLEKMDENVQSYLKTWGLKRLGLMVLAMKPTYNFAAKMYWNAMLKIAYLRKCKFELGRLVPQGQGFNQVCVINNNNIQPSAPPECLMYPQSI